MDGQEEPKEATMHTMESEQCNQNSKEEKKFKLLLDIEEYFSSGYKRKLTENDYNVFSIIDKNDPDRIKFTKIFQEIFKHLSEKKNQEDYKKLLGLNQKTERAVASLMGLGICDALGSCTQFTSFEKNRTDLIKYDFKDVEGNSDLHSRQSRYNIWTDDCSMALSLADSLILNNFKHVPRHTRYMFHMWLHHGLNNGGRRYSIGLGGNISISTRLFEHQQVDFTEKGDEFNNGNGSLMRLAPIPINFFHDEKEAMKAAQEQSRTTHNGVQAKQCCRLLTLIIVRLINREKFEWKSVIDKACQDFQTECKSVQCLAKSHAESHQLYEQQAKELKKFRIFNKKLTDRNWNWKDPNFTYSQSRADSMPGYVGSYCMDALSMALHTVWHGESFHKIALTNANMGGDCDTVGAIAGQISGAIYGIDLGMLHLYSQMEDTISGRFQVFLKAYKLATHHQTKQQ